MFDVLKAQSILCTDHTDKTVNRGRLAVKSCLNFLEVYSLSSGARTWRHRSRVGQIFDQPFTLVIWRQRVNETLLMIITK